MDAQRAAAASVLRQRASLQALAGARAKRDRAVHATWPASHTDSLRDMDRTCPRPRRDRLLIAWLHIPKCGTSFGNTLFHFANRSLPENASMDAVAAEARLAAARRGHQKASIRKGFPVGSVWRRRYPMATWFRGIFWLKGAERSPSNHHAISEDVLRRFRCSLYGLFRDPVLRAESAFHHFAPKNNLTRKQYAARIVGSATKMVSGQSFGLACVAPRGSAECLTERPRIEVALRRLPAFQFVGLTEQYALSICLFHATVGGPCLPVEFQNVRPGDYNGSEAQARLRSRPVLQGDAERYDFGDRVDTYDWTLYAAVHHRFARALRAFNVSEDRCRHEICPRAPPSADFSTAPAVLRRDDVLQRRWARLGDQALQQQKRMVYRPHPKAKPSTES